DYYCYSTDTSGNDLF
nr:immunoglobulin light chain junction region [Macaca mulatta]MOX18071.1 immunoglobulin light chain junction region [Macaca mulatta]MOX22948.1 immunoglobulin light chain junction region [Macaca mulatta]